MTEQVRRVLAIGLSALFPLSMLQAQSVAIEPVRPQASVIVRPYLTPDVPPVRLANSPRLAELVRGGALYLTAQDAIALALENNIDIEIARYNPIMASWRLERAKAGGALPGVPSVASQAGTVAAGQGVAGSQAAAGVGGGGGGRGGQGTNATISQIGPVTQNLDPAIQEATSFSHTSTPQANVVQSLTSVLINDTRVYSGSFQQGFLSGGGATVSYRDNYLKENSPTDLLNPSVAPSLSITAQHNLLRGFGIAVNARTITVSRLNLATSELQFKTQVVNVVNQVLNAYYSLASAYESLKAQRSAAGVAQTFFENVKRQIEIGSVAPPEQIGAETQLVTSRQGQVNAEATVKQQEIRLKNLLSRNGTADPVLKGVRIVPVDPLVMPPPEPLPPIEELVKQARANRADLLTQAQNVEAAGISALGTRNGILPTLQVFGAASAAGLAGTPHVVNSGGFDQTPDPYFDGGIGTALGQVFRRNFPTQRIGAFYQASLKNRQAQADFAIDQLQLRQTLLNQRKSLNGVEVDVLNATIAMQQARARYDAAVQNRVLQEQLFEAEQRRFDLGVSTPFNVIRQQRDLIQAQANALSALVSYNTARIGLNQTLGTTLEANGITMAEAQTGRVQHQSRLPDVLPPVPQVP